MLILIELENNTTNINKTTKYEEEWNLKVIKTIVVI